ncbi:MAG: NAD-dependent deacylase [Archaeoglobi archaeon]|nr:NAD-dependent deacylase [Candidatus Mnemosynella bozhongmuii]
MLEKVSEIIVSSKHLTALTGAGVSAESGIPTFRDEDGLWKRYRPEELATPEAFARDPEFVWKWYAWRMKKIFSARPNPAHEGFAELERMGILKTLITQNVDDLHERAGSKNVIHLHGKIRILRCIKCGKEIEISSPPEIPPLPRCECGSLLRPGVVWFGEPLPERELEMAEKEALRSDVMIVAGTSALVQPAASLPLLTKKNGGIIIEINPKDTPLSPFSDFKIRMKAGDAMRALLENIRKLVRKD